MERGAKCLNALTNVSDNANVRVVNFNPNNGYAYVRNDYANNRNNNRGAVLWLRGYMLYTDFNQPPSNSTDLLRL